MLGVPVCALVNVCYDLQIFDFYFILALSEVKLPTFLDCKIKPTALLALCLQLPV